jgi:hypothetical protein
MRELVKITWRSIQIQQNAIFILSRLIDREREGAERDGRERGEVRKGMSIIVHRQ